MNKLNCMMMAGTLLVTACQPTGKTGDVIGKQPVKVENVWCLLRKSGTEQK